MQPFIEALSLSEDLLRQWHSGEPRFDEWRKPDGTAKKPNPGRAREKAAQIIACRYGNSPQDSATPPPRHLDEFAKWVLAEKRMQKAAIEIADAWEDLGKDDLDKQVQTEPFLAELRAILLQNSRVERRRKLKEIQRVIKHLKEGTSYADVGGKTNTGVGGESPFASVPPELPFDTGKELPMGELDSSNLPKVTGAEFPHSAENEGVGDAPQMVKCDHCDLPMPFGVAACPNCRALYTAGYWQVGRYRRKQNSFYASN